MKKKLLLIFSALLLVALGIGAAIFFNQAQTPKTVLKDGTNTNPVSYEEADFYQTLKASYPQVYEHLDASGDQPYYVIPGLEQTQAIYHSGSKAGQVGTARDMDPQGMTVIEDKYLLISGYSKSKAFNSVIWVVDKKTGDYLKTLALDDIDHVGAITYDEDHDRLWVATINSQGKAQVESLSLAAIETYDLETSQAAISFEYETDLTGLPLTSYMAYHNGDLYIGYFNKSTDGILGRFDLDDQGLPVKDSNNQAAPSKTWPTYDQVQGISFYEDKILLSQSYGSQDSKLLIFDNKLDDANFDLDSGDAIASMTLPPYLEQILGYHDKVYLLFESASHLYRQKAGIIHMDRIIKISIEDLY